MISDVFNHCYIFYFIYKVNYCKFMKLNYIVCVKAQLFLLYFILNMFYKYMESTFAGDKNSFCINNSLNCIIFTKIHKIKFLYMVNNVSDFVRPMQIQLKQTKIIFVKFYRKLELFLVCILCVFLKFLLCI